MMIDHETPRPHDTTDPAPESDHASCEDYRFTRRHALTGLAAGAGAIAGSSILGPFGPRVAFGAAGGGNVLVVLSLRGGSDGLSIVVPHGNREYYSQRPHIAVPRGQLIWRDELFGLHPSLAPLLPMWRAGRFGAVHAVGLSTPNRSHFAATELVETAKPRSGDRNGWINRMIALDSATGQVEGVQFGSKLVATSLVGPQPVLGLRRLTDLELSVYDNAERTREGWSELWAASPGALGDNVRQALKTTRSLRSLSSRQVDASRYPDGKFGEALANTARLIKANAGAKVVAVEYGDWDMHAGLGTVDRGWMQRHLYQFAASLKAFFDDLGSTWGSRVTVVTMSEFGRRVGENGNGGVDHGYGNCMLLLGGGVRGGRVHGEWPGLRNQNDGDLRVLTDYRSVLSEVISRRFPGTNVSAVFPRFVPARVGAIA